MINKLLTWLFPEEKTTVEMLRDLIGGRDRDTWSPQVDTTLGRANAA